MFVIRLEKEAFVVKNTGNIKENLEKSSEVAPVDGSTWLLGFKRMHKPRRTFSGFPQICMELCGSKVQLAVYFPHRNFINNGVANPEIVYNSWKFHILNPRSIFSGIT